MDERVQLAYASIIARAEVHAILEEEDYFITTVDNGIAFFSEPNYNTLVEKTLNNFRTFLQSQELSAEAIEEEVDTFAANLVLHYIDHKSFSDERVQEVRGKYESLLNNIKEEKHTLPDATEMDDIVVESEDESRL